MATRSGFQNGRGIGSRSEQNIIQDLLDESIQIMGADCYYIPRQLANIDHLFGEDALNYFDTFVVIEMYLESFASEENSALHTELMGRFGLENKEEAVFRVSKRRWAEIVGTTGTTQLPNRPNEGDLVYYPMTNKLFEIKFVDFTRPYYQLNDYYSYTLQCTLFQYSSERFTTGADEIDSMLPDTLDRNAYIAMFDIDDSLNSLLIDSLGSPLTEAGIITLDVPGKDPISINSEVVADAYNINISDSTGIPLADADGIPITDILLPAFDATNPFGTL